MDRQAPPEKSIPVDLARRVEGPTWPEAAAWVGEALWVVKSD
jgi:hypothetical protein